MNTCSMEKNDFITKEETKLYCPFCNGVQINGEYVGEGIMTVNMIMGSLFGSEDTSENETDCSNGIILKGGNVLFFDNSAQEYASLGIKIRYCPFCGRELKSDDDAN